jgi:cytochrome c
MRVQHLVDSGVNPDECAGGPGWTTSPLVAASATNHVEVVKILIAAGADPNQSCRAGSPLDLAANNGYVDAMNALKWDPAIVKMLLEGGADAHARDPSGSSLIAMATDTGRYRSPIEQLLIAAGAVRPTHRSR